MNTGSIKFYNKEKKFGFIVGDEDGKDIFFHESGLSAGTVNKDDKVSYDIGSNKNGACAINVKKY